MFLKLDFKANASQVFITWYMNELNYVFVNETQYTKALIFTKKHIFIVYTVILKIFLKQWIASYQSSFHILKLLIKIFTSAGRCTVMLVMLC